MDVNFVMFKANGQRKDFPINKPLSVIGRGENCELRIPLVSVSRRHCEVNLSDEEVKVKDLASSNGTYVNNKRINECSLSAGDRLVIGPIVFTVQIDGVPEAIQPVKARSAQTAGAAAATEEVVELEADVIAKASAGDADALTAVEDEAGEEMDPIAALEALAAESRKKEKGK